PTLCSHTSSFVFNSPTPSRISSLSLHDALPIWQLDRRQGGRHGRRRGLRRGGDRQLGRAVGIPVEQVDHQAMPVLLVRGQGEARSEEHTSELQSRENLVCRLLLEKKKKQSTGIA